MNLIGMLWALALLLLCVAFRISHRHIIKICSVALLAIGLAISQNQILTLGIIGIIAGSTMVYAARHE